MSSTIMIALIMVGSIALVVGLLVFVTTVTGKKNPAINSHDHLMRVARPTLILFFSLAML